MRVAYVAACALIVFAIVLPASDKPLSSTKREAGGSKPGIKTPGVQIPFASLKAETEIPLDGAPGLPVIGESVWLANSAKDSILALDPKTAKAGTPITGLHKPCSGVVSAFKSLWSPNCGDHTLVRLDPKTGKVTASMEAGTPVILRAIAASDDSIWLFSDAKTTLLRIDPDQNAPVGELRLPAGCSDIVFGETAVWVTCPAENKVLRIDPRTNLVANRIETAAGPRALAVGEGSVWVLCDTEGKVARIDPKTNKVSATIALNIPQGGGNIAVGEGSVWVTSSGFPITRIDPQPEKEKVVQQFTGEGGGLISAGAGSIWLANPVTNSVSRFDPKRIIATLAE